MKRAKIYILDAIIEKSADIIPVVSTIPYTFLNAYHPVDQIDAGEGYDSQKDLRGMHSEPDLAAVDLSSMSWLTHQHMSGEDYATHHDMYR